METNINLRSILNDLIQTCKDGQEGYLTAAENVSDEEVRKFFNQCSLHRAKFAGELQSLAHELGDSNPEYASSVAGAIHRGWINLKSAIANREAHAILRECERGESCAVEEYDKALQLALPANIRETIFRQCTAIRADHDHVSTLADSAAPHWV
jgi:uncharacterized protein (TIGR02284 family)